jgi:hypothetical protein
MEIPSPRPPPFVRSDLPVGLLEVRPTRDLLHQIRCQNSLLFPRRGRLSLPARTGRVVLATSRYGSIAVLLRYNIHDFLNACCRRD